VDPALNLFKRQEANKVPALLSVAPNSLPSVEPVTLIRAIQ
jgi:hypothetical protein